MWPAGVRKPHPLCFSSPGRFWVQLRVCSFIHVFIPFSTNFGQVLQWTGDYLSCFQMKKECTLDNGTVNCELAHNTLRISNSNCNQTMFNTAVTYILFLSVSQWLTHTSNGYTRASGKCFQRCYAITGVYYIEHLLKALSSKEHYDSSARGEG